LKKEQVDAVEIAEKQRHLYLLERVKNNKTLSKGELDELAELEKKQQKSTKRGKARTCPERSRRIAAEQIIKTQKEAAQYASVNTRTIRRWIKNGMPRTEQGFYIKGMLDFYKKNEGTAPDEDRLRQQKAEASLKETKSQLAELELKFKQGEFLNRADYEKQQVAKVIAVKRALLGMGRKLAPRLAKLRNTRKVQAIINEEVRNIIERFAKK